MMQADRRKHFKSMLKEKLEGNYYIRADYTLIDAFILLNDPPSCFKQKAKDEPDNMFHLAWNQAMAVRGTEPSPFFTNMKSAPRAATLFIYRREWARCRQPHICKDTVTIQFSIKDTPVHITHTFHQAPQYRRSHTEFTRCTCEEGRRLQ